MLDAVLLISSGLDLRGSLDRLVQASCALTDARYGVIGLLDADGVIADFVIHGVDDETKARIASLPTCEGVLARCRALIDLLEMRTLTPRLSWKGKSVH